MYYALCVGSCIQHPVQRGRRQCSKAPVTHRPSWWASTSYCASAWHGPEDQRARKMAGDGRCVTHWRRLKFQQWWAMGGATATPTRLYMIGGWLGRIESFLGWGWIGNKTWNILNLNKLNKGLLDISEKPSSQYLGFICGQWHAEVWIRIRDISVVLLYYLCSYGESRLPVLWCVRDRCGIIGTDVTSGF
jgi:hypothetical protein